MLRRDLPNMNSIGQRILLDRPAGEPDALEVVGVVGNSKRNELAAEMIPEFYRPFAQTPRRRLWLVCGRRVRTGLALMLLGAA
jgi:hypothetical protein